MVRQGLDLKEYLSKDAPEAPPLDLSYWQYLGGKLTPQSASAVSPVDVPTSDTTSPPVGSREAMFEGVPLSVTRDHVSAINCSSIAAVLDWL